MRRIHNVQVSGRELNVFLPPSYLAADRHYPVAYVQDDGDLFSCCYNYIDHLVAQGELTEIILVGIPSHERNREYTPWPAESLVQGLPTFDGMGSAYVQELADVIKPAIDSRYRTLPDAANTAIMGASLGGLISLFAGFWRPEVFGRLGLLSASFWYDGVMSFLRERQAPSCTQRIFMSVGDCEGIYKTNAQRNMVVSTKEVHAIWLEKGFPEQQLRFALTEGGTHDLLYMAQQFPQALQWLFGTKENSGDGHEGEALVPFRRVTCRFDIPNTLHFSIRAKATGREYRIFLSIPPVPPPAEGYPVLYVLDGNAVFGSVTEAMRLQSREPHGIEPQVIVGIGYDADVPMVTNERFYDYTEAADASELPVRRDDSAWPKTGGIEDFISFIEEELKAAIERQCPIDRSRQGIVGHSLGGYFALYVLFTRPEAFQTYIAGSPSIWWKNHSLLKKWPAVEQRLLQKEIHAALLIAVGAEEKAGLVADAEEMVAKLLPYQGDHFQVSFRKMEGEGHVSVLHPMISEIMRFIG